MQNRTLYFGDNLEILREKFPDLPDGEGYFDLIYLDPPFNSSRDYNVLFKEGLADSQAQVQAFEDSWHWTEEAQSTFEELVGVKKSKTNINEQVANLMLALEKLVGHNDVLAYLTMMTIRLIELRRVLKKTGSIYLHCDPTASHYLKIVMDAIFGKKNFVNEIIWQYDGPQSPSPVKFASKHDTILRYAKNIQDLVGYEMYYEEEVSETYSTLKRDKYGSFRIMGVGDYSEESIKKLEQEHRIYVSKTGKRYVKYYFRERNGKLYKDKKIPDVWDDITPLSIATQREKLGYPTQKPEKLLERIIKASSKEGDWVLDPFCGCGTTVSVAERLNRKWAGIDITALAINLIKHRLRKQFSDKTMQIHIDGLPKDLVGARALFKKDPFEFEYWALDLVNAMPSQSKSKQNMRGADKGVDGVITFVKDIQNGTSAYGKILVQVKGGGVQRNDIATLKGDVDREKAEGGLFLTLEEPTRPMREEAASAGKYAVRYSKEEFPKIEIITIKDLLGGQRPKTPLWSLPYYKEAKKVDYNPMQDQTRIEFL